LYSRSNIDWEKTKRLLTGSLLCISGDGFRTLLWATVEKRDPKALQQRKIEIRWRTALSIVSSLR
jgi:hypothetical protein